jgi:hypothetical protein
MEAIIAAIIAFLMAIVSANNAINKPKALPPTAWGDRFLDRGAAEGEGLRGKGEDSGSDLHPRVEAIGLAEQGDGLILVNLN